MANIFSADSGGGCGELKKRQKLRMHILMLRIRTTRTPPALKPEAQAEGYRAF